MSGANATAKPPKKLRDKLKSQGVRYDKVCTDKRDSFIAVFQEDNHVTGKEHTKGIGGFQKNLLLFKEITESSESV